MLNKLLSELCKRKIIFKYNKVKFFKIEMFNSESLRKNLFDVKYYLGTFSNIYLQFSYSRSL